MGLTSSLPCALCKQPKGGFNIYTPEIISKGWGGQHLAPSAEEGQGKSDEYNNMSTQT